jgi:hypothetical protein
MVARLDLDPVPTVLSRDTLVTVRMSGEPSTAALHPDGDRWIFTRPTQSDRAPATAEPERMILIQNWLQELERLVPN